MGVVIVNRTDYITKMATILDDKTKFLKLGDLSLDDTHKIKIKFLELFGKNYFLRSLRVNPSQSPRIYGLPKIHKSGIPLRPNLSLCHSAQHELAKRLIQLLNPVLEFYSGFRVDDSFPLLPLFVNFLLMLTQHFWCLLIFFRCLLMFLLMKQFLCWLFIPLSFNISSFFP